MLSTAEVAAQRTPESCWDDILAQEKMRELGRLLPTPVVICMADQCFVTSVVNIRPFAPVPNSKLSLH